MAVSEKKPLQITLVGPVATADISPLLDGDLSMLPIGYAGAPLLTTLVSALLERGHSLTVVTLSRGMLLDWRRSVVASGKNLTVIYVPMRPRAWRPNGWKMGRVLDLFAFERKGLCQAIKSVGSDVIHAHWSYEFAWATLQSGYPHVITCHDAPFVVARLSKSPYRWIRAGMAWYVLRHAKNVTTVSPYMKGLIQPMCGVPVSVVPNLLPKEITAYSRRTVVGRIRLAAICNGWVPLKNPESTLRAFALIAKQLPHAELHVYGSDFGAGEIAERWWNAEKLEGNICFHGSVSYAVLQAELAQTDLLIHGSLEESFGMVIAEAMAIGVPVVAGENCGAVSWVVGSGGVLVDVKNPRAIAEAVVALLGDTERIEMLGENARRQANTRFSADKIADEYEKVYWAAISGCCEVEARRVQSVIAENMDCNHRNSRHPT